MTRPTFLDNPHGLNVSSSAADPVRYASAVERTARSPWRLADLAVVAVAIVSAALIAAGVI